MNGRERLRRENPERTEPLRHWSKLYRDPDSWNPRDTGAAPESEGAAEADPGAQPESWNEVVAEGVSVAYRVIEEQMRQGQRVAEQISDASYGPTAITGDLREAGERMVRYSADLVALWLDFVNSTMANGDLLRNLTASWQQAAGAPSNPPHHGSTASFAVEVCSSRPVRVCFDLKDGAAGRPLASHGLCALEPEKPRLADVAFETGSNGGPLLVRLHVPADHPAGLYTGVVVDAETGAPLGTLSAHVAE